MKSDPKTLVILDTNKIRSNFEWEKDYSNFEPKGDFIKIINWIEGSKLQDQVFIGLPEIVVEELVDNRSRNFEQQLETLKSSTTRLEKMSCFDLSKMILPGNDFDYRDFIKEKIKEYVRDKTFIIILKLEKKLYAKTLDSLIKKAVIKEKPFTDSGRGFKDALIWETILNFKGIDKYSNIFLLSENQKDFDIDLQEEFKKKFSKDMNLEVNTTTLIVNLENIYGLQVNYQDILSYLKTDYFKSKLTELLSETYDLKIKNFKIKNILEINDTTLNNLEEFELADTYSEEDLPNLKRVNLLFENNKHQFNAELIFEHETNEIVALNYEEMK